MPFISICIPAYNRPSELLSLLDTIDCDPSFIDIVIAEDNSPNRLEIRSVVASFSSRSPYNVVYLENDTNIGFDANLRTLVSNSSSDYIIFMGDDDLFVPGALSKYISFLLKNQDKPYVLRSYLTVHDDGHTEYFNYLPRSQTLRYGEKTVSWLFKRSVSLCGFTISRNLALKYATNDLDGTLLYQVYLMSNVCLHFDSVYCDIPFGHAVQTFRQDTPMFGSSDAEKSRFSPGSVSFDNSINFAKAYFEVTNYLDKQYGTDLTTLVKNDLSKYSYPFLSIQRKRGIKSFLLYANRLDEEVGLGSSYFFFIYKWSLVFLGENLCDRVISFVKRKLGHTPNF